MTELLIQPSIRDPSNDAIAGAGIAGRLSDLDLSRLLVYRIDGVVASALPVLIEQFSRGGYDGGLFAESDAERRSLVKTAIGYHRLKGTLAGFRAAARLARSSVEGAVTPPATAFCGTSMTRAERDDFLRRYPELRLYPFRNRGQKGFGLMFGAAFIDGRDAPGTSDAAARLGEVATIVRSGTETPLRSIERTLEEVGIKLAGRAGFGMFIGRLAPGYPFASDAPKRYYQIHLGAGAYSYAAESLHLRSVVPGLDPIAARYELAATPGRAAGVFQGAGGRWAHVAGWLVDHRADLRLYKRWYLYDPEIDIPERRAALFVGAQRLTMPAHHAELAVSIPGRHAARVVGRYVFGCLPARGPRKLDRTLGALRAASRFSDKIWVRTALHRRLLTNTSVTAGDRLCGELTAN